MVIFLKLSLKSTSCFTRQPFANSLFTVISNDPVSRMLLSGFSITYFTVYRCFALSFQSEISCVTTNSTSKISLIHILARDVFVRTNRCAVVMMFVRLSCPSVCLWQACIVIIRRTLLQETLCVAESTYCLVDLYFIQQKWLLDWSTFYASPIESLRCCRYTRFSCVRPWMSLWISLCVPKKLWAPCLKNRWGDFAQFWSQM